MGADWVRKREDRFKRQLQENTKQGFKPTPLFIPEEEETITYACHWLQEDKTFPVGTKLTIYNPSKTARLLVLHCIEAVAEVWGEAVKDLKNLFQTHSELRNMLPVEIVQIAAPTEPFYVQPLRAAKRRAKAV